MNAQDARQALTLHGWLPLTGGPIVSGAISAEHWVRGGRRCIIHYEGEFPSRVELDKALYVHFRELESGEIIAEAE